MYHACATCEVSIRGSFDERWVNYLGEMLLRTEVAAGNVKSTTLFAKLPDMAAFIGMLNFLADSGVVVVACAYRRTDESRDAAADGGTGASPKNEEKELRATFGQW